MGTGAKVRHPSDVCSRGAHVWVKVLTVAGAKISLSMRDVDQRTGEDLAPNDHGPDRTHIIPRDEEAERFREERRRRRLSHAKQESVSGIPKSFVQDDHNGRRKESGRMRRALPENEQWELTQLGKILSQKELRKQIGFNRNSVGNPADFDAEDDVDGQVLLMGENDGPMDETEIELNEDEPAFLRISEDNTGLTRAQPLSPVRIVKNPDGSMQRAAMTQSALAKDAVSCAMSNVLLLKMKCL